MGEPHRIAGVVLCGGQSRRMGTPKEWLDLDGQPMLVHVVRLVQSAVDPVIVARRSAQSIPVLPAGVEVVDDAIQGVGPLAGMQAAFERLRGRAEAAFVSPCDHPFLSAAFVRRLVDSLDDQPAIVLRVDGHTRPLPGVFRLDTLNLLHDLISQGEYRVGAFAERCGASSLDASTLLDVDPGLRSLQNLNHIADYDAARTDVAGWRSPSAQEEAGTPPKKTGDPVE